MSDEQPSPRQPIDASHGLWCSQCGLPLSLGVAYSENPALGLMYCRTEHVITGQARTQAATRWWRR